jgi:DNA-directed RNA polymerase subunit RPC12/RpoP
MSMEIKYVCEKCGKEPQKNESKSNKNWKVYDNKPCEYCGGKLTIKLN